MTTRSLWHISPTESQIKQADRQRNPGELLVQALFSMVSLGTESLVATGKVPAAMYDSMQVPYQEGSLALPVKYGYSLVGKVLEGPGDWPEQTVHLMHPHQDYCVVRPEDCFLVPESVDPATAVLASNLETALNAVWDARLSAGDRVLVVGFGAIGALTARLAMAFPATRIMVLEPEESRREIARNWGLEIWEETSDPVDIAFHTSRTSQGLQRAIDAAGREGLVVELSWYGNHPVRISLGGDFHILRKQVISSQVSRIPAHQSPRWDFTRRKEVVFRLLQNLDWADFLQWNISFEEAESVFRQVRNRDYRGLTCIFNY